MGRLTRKFLDLLGVPKSESLPTRQEVAEELRYMRRQLRGPKGKFALAAATIGTLGFFCSPGSRALSSVQGVFEVSPLIGVVTLVLVLVAATMLVVGIAVAVVAPIGAWILENVLGYTIIAPKSEDDRTAGTQR